MLTRNKLVPVFLVFLLLQPVLDVLTNLLMNTFGINLSLGIIVRTLVMLVFMLFVLKEVFTNKDHSLMFHIAAITFLAAMQLIVTLLFKEGASLGSEITFLVKSVYPVVLIFALFYLMRSKEELHRLSNVVMINGIVISTFILVPTWLNFSFDSYDHGLKGSLGFYSSGNEISAVLMFAYFFSVYTLFFRKGKQTILPFLSVFLITWSSFYVGTKVAIGAILVIAVLFTLAIFIFRMKEVKKTNAAFLAVPFIFSLLFFNGVPAAENSQMAEEQQAARNQKYETPELYYAADDVARISEVVRLREKVNPIITKIVSSRDIYAIETYEDYERAHVMRKLFGLGYAGDYYDDVDVKIIEMDFIDYIFSFGIVGTVYFLLVFVSFLVFTVKAVFSTRGVTRGKILYALFAFLLAMSVSLLAGHIWFAPAVSIYLAAMVIMLYRVTQLDTMPEMKS